MYTKQTKQHMFLSLFILFLMTLGFLIGKWFHIDISYERGIPENPPPCTAQQFRKSGYVLIRPLLMADLCSEDSRLNPIKNEIQTLINQEKSNGNLTSASVYFRKLDELSLITLNDNETYNPGSMMKVAILITYLRDAEKNPDLLNKKITYPTSLEPMPSQTFTGPPLEQGQTYTIEKLLYHLIVYSDNAANFLLNQNMNYETLGKLFLDLHLRPPSKFDVDYSIRPSEYARFFRILFNGSYLTSQNSEYALNLLTTAAYHEGLSKVFGNNAKIAHKFGEHFENGKQQLHEFGIVYYRGKAFLIGIMTKGADTQKLSMVIQKIAAVLNEEVSKSTGDPNEELP